MNKAHINQACRYGKQIGDLENLGMLSEVMVIKKAWSTYINQFKDGEQESLIIAFTIAYNYGF